MPVRVYPRQSLGYTLGRGHRRGVATDCGFGFVAEAAEIASDSDCRRPPPIHHVFAVSLLRISAGRQSAIGRGSVLNLLNLLIKQSNNESPSATTGRGPPVAAAQGRGPPVAAAQERGPPALNS